jgi:ribosomal-protein-serine acetyltransferase
LNLTSPTPLSFKSARLLIRRYRKDDEDFLYNAARESIREVFPFLPWCHPDYDREDTVGWLDMVESNWRQGEAYNFAIFSEDGSTFHGGCGLNNIDEHPVANLGYWIRTSSTGQGLATEATIALAAFGLAELGLQRIEIIMSTENIASRKVAIGAGAVEEGILRQRLLLHGRPHDAYVYSLVKDKR